MTISLNNIVKSFDGNIIFENISCTIYDGDKVGLIGINGVGKTTLIKILMGEEEYDEGVVSITPSYLKIAYLKQLCDIDENVTVYEKLNSFARAMSTEGNSSSYGKKLREALINIGFKERDLNKKIGKLSGGEKTRLSLCLVLSENPDVLILDEPTNHLDLEGIKWLEKFLKSIDKTLIIISHDRLFLDNTVNKILHMNENRIKEYKGNYTDYKRQEQHIKNTLQNTQDKQDKEIKKLESILEKRMDWYNKAESDKKKVRKLFGKGTRKESSSKHMNVYRSKTIRLNKLKENRVEVPKDDVSANFNTIGNTLKEEVKASKYIIKVNRLKKTFGNKVIFNNVAFHVKGRDKIALMGNNGSGKTTLLKMLLGLEKEDSGTVNLNPSLKIAYFAQELDNLNLDNNLIEEIRSCGLDKEGAMRVLGNFLFKGEDLFRKIETLSMGEKCRVAFAKLLTKDFNILILDEPTNHMDIVSKENIEKALREYEGTIIFVSHDRYFIKTIATRIFSIENHDIKVYEGDYDYYLYKKEEEKIKSKVGINYINVKDEIIRLECEMAYLTSKLKNKHVDINVNGEDENIERFFYLSQKLREYKSQVIS